MSWSLVPLLYKSSKIFESTYEGFINYLDQVAMQEILVQGVKGESGKCLSSKFGKNQCFYCNKRYISKKPLISALISHLESDCSSKIDFWRGHRSQIRKIFEFKIWKESMLVLKQTIQANKPLISAFI